MNKTVFFENYDDVLVNKTRIHFYEVYNSAASFSPIWVFGHFEQSVIVNDRLVVVTKGNEPLAGLGEAGYLNVFNMDGSILSSIEFAASGTNNVSLYVTPDNRILIMVNEAMYIYNFDCILLSSYSLSISADAIVSGIGNSYMVKYEGASTFTYNLLDINGNTIVSSSITKATNNRIFAYGSNPMELWYADIISMSIGLIKMGSSSMEIVDSSLSNMITITSIKEGSNGHLYLFGTDASGACICSYDKDLSVVDSERIDLTSLPTTSAFGFDIDDLGGIWVFGTDGLYRYKKIGNNFILIDGSISAVPGPLTVSLAGGFEAPTESSSYRYLLLNSHVEKIAISSSDIICVNKGNSISSTGSFESNANTISKGKNHIYAIISNNSLVVMTEGGAYIKTIIIDSVGEPTIKSVMPFLRRNVALIGTISSLEYLYIIDIENGDLISKTEMTYASSYSGKYSVNGLGSVYYIGSSTSDCILVKYNALGDEIWKRVISDRSSELFGDSYVSKVLGVVPMIDGIYVCYVYLDNYNVVGPKIDLMVGFNKYSSDGYMVDFGSFKIAEFSAVSEANLRNGYVSGDVVENIEGGIYYSVIIDTDIITSVDVSNGHGIDEGFFSESIEKVILGVDIDNRPIIELKCATENLISKVYVGGVAGSTSGSFEIVLGAVNNIMKYVDEWDTEDVPVFKEV